MRKEIDYLILGSGISGLSVAYHLKTRKIGSFLVIDKNLPGGLLTSITDKEFTFDVGGGHVLHTRNQYYEDFVLNMLGSNILRHKRKAYFTFEGGLYPYPFQVYFYKIPNISIVNECIKGLVIAINNVSHSKPRNFEEWIYHFLGKGIAKYFMVPYNKKLWHYPLDQISLEWVDKYIPKVDPSELLKKVANLPKDENEEYGYNVYFYYPKIGGIQALISAIIEKLNLADVLLLKTKLVKIDLIERYVLLGDGTRIFFKYLINTIPLNELIDLIKQVPENLRILKRNLKWVSILTINLGIRGQLNSDAHWIYIPEESIPFHRVVIQSNLSPYTVPDEQYYSLIIERSFKPEERVKANIDEYLLYLRKIKLLDRDSKIIVVKVNKIKYAYPIYNFERAHTVKELLPFLEKHNVFSIGRFGAWEYSSIEDCFIQSKELIGKILTVS